MQDFERDDASTKSWEDELGSSDIGQLAQMLQADITASHTVDIALQEKIEHPEKKDLVDWQGPYDPQYPQNWSLVKKLYITITVASCTFVVVFGSSVLSAATEVLSTRFHVSTEVVTLSLSLYVLGFAAGPLVWAPLGDVLGRKLPFLAGFLGFMCFTVGVATAQNLHTIMICRFMQGAWGVSTITVVPGMIVDLWRQEHRTMAVLSWAVTIVLGPSMAPIVGSFTVKNASLGWRWTMWMTLIISAPLLVLSVFIPETWAPLLLKRRAAHLRWETKNWSLHARLDENPTGVRQLIRRYGLKPVQMLFREPILAAVTAYTSFVYGVMYLTFEAFPFSFGIKRGWESGVSSLPFIAIGIGYYLGFGAYVLLGRWTNRRAKDAGRPLVPEDQLPPMILGSFLFIIGLFWFAWTSYPTITWIPQVLSGLCIGAGVFTLFVSCVIYIMECYLANANSALAANTLARSLVAAGFPLFGTQMYGNLGVPWATSLLGFLAVALTPFPMIFYIYGKKIRGWSKYAY